MPRGGGIADITYVADWDAKGRSNDEEEPMRSQWIDKATGKVINLSNYAYSQMSGWGGYKLPPFTTIKTYPDRATASVMASSIQVSAIYAKETTTLAILEWTAGIDIGESPVSQAFKISGIPDGYYVVFDYLMLDGAESTALFSTKNSGDGVYTAENIPPDATFYRWTIKMNNDDFISETICDLKIEMIPLYPGALVSDGVDDRGLGAEPITEEIKTVVMHLVGLAPVWTFFIEGADGDQTKRIGATYSNGKLSVAGIGYIENDGKPYSFSRNIPAPNNKLNIGCAEYLTKPTEYGKSAISRLIFIKEKLDEYQQEFLMWKVSKEYRDWCKENGYDYAINEMLNN